MAETREEIGPSWNVLMICGTVLIVLFAGSPSLMDAIIVWLAG